MNRLSFQHGPLTAKHLLRALLRECTYLPDATARAYFPRYILTRFRKHSPKTWRGNNATERQATASQDAALSEKRVVALLRTARKGLSLLRRANAGEAGPLLNVLLHAYGRTGRRRRVLLAPLLRPHEDAGQPPDSAESRKARLPLQQYLHTDKLFASYFDMPQDKGDHDQYEISKRYPLLRALAASQAQAPLPALTKPKLRKAKLLVPKKNIWQRPMPRKRTRNMIARWFADLMHKLLPPLPQTEWKHLVDLVSGAAKWDGVPKKRPGVDRKPHELPPLELEELLDADRGDRLHLEATRSVLEDALRLRYLNRNFPGKNRPHHVTSQFMKRLWRKVLSQSCFMTWDDRSKKWSVEWGYRDPGFPGTDAALFAGVDLRGRLLSDEGTKARDSGASSL